MQHVNDLVNIWIINKLILMKYELKDLKKKLTLADGEVYKNYNDTISFLEREVLKRKLPVSFN